MEMVVENGRGYVPSTEHSVGDHEIGIIPSMRSSVQRLVFVTSSKRPAWVKTTNYDRLILEIWTDGSITPEMALTEGSKILRKHLNPFVQYRELARRFSRRVAAVPVQQKPQLEAKLNMKLGDLRLSVRANNCLESENIQDRSRAGPARTEDQLLEVRNFGDTTLNEVRENLLNMVCIWACVSHRRCDNCLVETNCLVEKGSDLSLPIRFNH